MVVDAEESMEFELSDALSVLSRSPEVVEALLADLPDDWARSDDGPGTWSAFDVLGHLIHGERADWMPRARRILREGAEVPFDPVDREAQFQESRGRSVRELLSEFKHLRVANLRELDEMHLQAGDLARRGRHPALGEVTMGQLLATWVAHDLNHIGQMVEVLSRQYRVAVGPWRQYLAILD